MDHTKQIQSVTMKQDHSWLESYSELLTGKRVLELGCGSGLDTRIISRYSESVIACDAARGANKDVLLLDHSKRFPFENGAFDTVVASLCLHYFTLETTKSIIEEIARVQTAGGRFICRLNSYKDENYGAVGFPEIEPGLYNVNGEQKRFFTEQEIHALWSQRYKINEIGHKIIDRYAKDKYVYEFCATTR